MFYGVIMKRTVKIVLASIVFSSYNTHSMEKGQELETLDKIYESIQNLTIPDKELEKLLTEVCKTDYKDEQKQKLCERGKNRAATYLLYQCKAQDFNKKMERTNLYLVACRPFFTLFEILKQTDHSLPKYTKALEALAQMAMGGQECKSLLTDAAILGRTLDSKSPSDGENSAERLYLEYVHDAAKKHSNFFGKLKKTPAQFDEIEHELTIENLDLRIKYLERSILGNFGKEFIQYLQVREEGISVKDTMEYLQELKNNQESKDSALQSIDLQECAKEGEIAANLYHLTLYSAFSNQIQDQRNKNFTESWQGPLGKLAQLCLINPITSKEHQGALEGFRVFFKAIDDTLAPLSYNEIDFSKGKDQDIGIDYPEIKNELSRTLLKNLHDLAISATTIGSYKELIALITDWQAKGNVSIQNYQEELAALKDDGYSPEIQESEDEEIS